ncbi:MAG TPA: hypothetical protein DDZ67_12610, partial [Xanthomonadaceae bacterium]|nr:hypothetical protein [Xanthomonadaceae bacterium]
MPMLDLLADPAATVRALAAAKAAGIEQRKASDPAGNHPPPLGKDDEAVLDLVLPAADANDDIVVERNACRYVPGPAGCGVLLIGIGGRGYGDAAARACCSDCEGLTVARRRRVDRGRAARARSGTTKRRSRSVGPLAVRDAACAVRSRIARRIAGVAERAPDRRLVDVGVDAHAAA